MKIYLTAYLAGGIEFYGVPKRAYASLKQAQDSFDLPAGAIWTEGGSNAMGAGWWEHESETWPRPVVLEIELVEAP